MDENLISLAKRLKTIRKFLKETAEIPHQLEFIEDINNQLKSISGQLKAIFEEIDATIVENQELLAAARQGVQRAAASGEALASILLSCDKLTIHAAMRLDHVKANSYTACYTKQALPVHTTSEPAVGEEGIGASGDVYLNIADHYFILSNKSRERFKFIKPSGEDVTIDHESIVALAKALQERTDELEIPLEKKTPLVEKVSDEDKIKATQYVALSGHLNKLFDETGLFNVILKHAKYVTAVDTGLIPKGDYNPDDLILMREPLAKAINVSAIGSDGVINIRTKSYTVSLKPTGDSVTYFSHDFAIYSPDGFGWALTHFNSENQVKDFFSELRSRCAQLTTA